MGSFLLNKNVLRGLAKFDIVGDLFFFFWKGFMIQRSKQEVRYVIRFINMVKKSRRSTYTHLQRCAGISNYVVEYVLAYIYIYMSFSPFTHTHTYIYIYRPAVLQRLVPNILSLVWLVTGQLGQYRTCQIFTGMFVT